MSRLRLSLRTLPAALAAALIVATGAADARAASPAQAFPVGGAEFQKARAVATAHWGGKEACGGNVSISWVDLDPGTNATASWRNPTDAWANVDQNFDCRIDINTRSEYDFPKLCTVLAHELGHLLGNAHPDTPGLLMSAYYSDPLGGCVAAASAPAPQAAAQPTAQSSAKPAVAPAAAKKVVAKKKPLRKSAAKKKTVKRKKRCFTRFKAGKRVKRCITVKRRAVAARSR